MSSLTISIFENKIFYEIVKEIKLFSKYKIKYYKDLDLCIEEAKKGNLLVIFCSPNDIIFTSVSLLHNLHILISVQLILYYLLFL